MEIWIILDFIPYEGAWIKEVLSGDFTLDAIKLHVLKTYLTADTGIKWDEQNQEYESDQLNIYQIRRFEVSNKFLT